MAVEPCFEDYVKSLKVELIEFTYHKVESSKAISTGLQEVTTREENKILFEGQKLTTIHNNFLESPALSLANMRHIIDLSFGKKEASTSLDKKGLKINQNRPDFDYI